ncbi:MAG: phasin family protein [Telluria sp.]
MQSLANNPALRSHVETQVNFLIDLTHRSYDAARKLSELNLQLARQLIEDSVETSRQVLACTDPFQVTALAMRRAEPLGQHLRAYQQQLMALVAGSQSELTHATEAHLPQAGRSAAAMADDIARRSAGAGATWSPPAGSGQPH